MKVRKFSLPDLEACLATRPPRIGGEVIGYDCALSAWKSIASSVAFRSVVVESEKPIRGNPIVGFGASVFVSTAFARDATSSPRPGLNERIISSIHRGQSVVLTEAQLQQQNTFGELSMVILFTSWREGLTPEEITEIKLELAKGGVDCLAGYRLEQILLEAQDLDDIEYINSTGVYRTICDFTELPDNDCRKCDGGLYVMDKVSVGSVTGSVATFVFQYTRPLFHFKKVDQQLLEAALEGLTDRELSQSLHLSIEAVKKRWASVFERVEQVMPSLLPVSLGDTESQTRGAQKRHRVLAYLRTHLEELRPHIS